MSKFILTNSVKPHPNASDGNAFGFDINGSIYSHDGGSTCYYQNISKACLEAGEEVTFRTVGVAGFDPESLSDSFELKINLLDSSEEKQEFVYAIG